MEPVKVLITVKTHPIPSAKYDELVCTAGVKADGSFIRLYPINFRDLPYSQQYRKYQWIEVDVTKHKGRDARKESYRPDSQTIQTLGEPISTTGDETWSKRARFVLRNESRSIEDLRDQQERDRTSLGIFKPKSVRDLVISQDVPDWKPQFKAALAQTRIWDDRKVTKEPPRKVPYRFQYLFECDDSRCSGKHRMTVEDWEVGALYWRLVDQGAEPLEAAQHVKVKFLNELCSVERDTYFFVGTILQYPNSWIVIGVFWPKVALQPSLFPLAELSP